MGFRAIGLPTSRGPGRQNTAELAEGKILAFKPTMAARKEEPSEWLDPEDEKYYTQGPEEGEEDRVCVGGGHNCGHFCLDDISLGATSR